MVCVWYLAFILQQCLDKPCFKKQTQVLVHPQMIKYWYSLKKYIYFIQLRNVIFIFGGIWTRTSPCVFIVVGSSCQWGPPGLHTCWSVWVCCGFPEFLQEPGPRMEVCRLGFTEGPEGESILIVCLKNRNKQYGCRQGCIDTGLGIGPILCSFTYSYTKNAPIPTFDTGWHRVVMSVCHVTLLTDDTKWQRLMINGCKLCSVKISRATAFSHITSKLIKLSTRSSSLGAHDRALTQYIVIDDHPPSVLENEGFHLKEAKNTSLVVEVHRLARGHCLNQGNINGAK